MYKSDNPMHQKIVFLFTFFLIISGTLAAQQATVKGRVFDVVNNEPLPFVNIVVAGTTTGTISDLDGNFILTGLKPGFVRIQASFVGYDQAISPEIEISSARTATVEIPMKTSDQQIEEVTVTATPFRKTEESPVSLRTIGIGEIENSPGANRDISRVIQSFPGVQSTPAFRNDIIIRGGGPSESRFFLDGVEVPNINHFATQGASGGPVGILNADLLREVNYYSGAFPANRGNALSGVLEFSQTDGNSDKLKFRGSVGASELSATLDGPMGDKTTYIVSARRSYLKFLFSLIELPFLPTFTDMQFKVRTRFDKKNELTLTGLGAIDQFDLNMGIEDPDDQQKYILGNIAYNEQWNYSVGAVYKHYRDNSYQTVVLSRNHLNNSAYKYLDNDDSSEENKLYDFVSEEIENKFRVESNTRVNGYKINFGAGAEASTYTNNTVGKRLIEGMVIPINYNTDLNLLKWSLFGQVSKPVFNDRLTLSLGVRADANNYSSGMGNLLRQVSPRFSASYALAENWSLNFNTGRYFQLPSYTTLGYKVNNRLVNKDNNLKYISVDHLVGGVEYRPQSGILFTVEGFMKNYANYPFSVNDSISLANKGAGYGVVGDEEVTSTSEGRAYGAEFQTRITTGKGFNLNLSYTLVRSEFKDWRQELIPSSWDSKHLVVLTSTREMKRNWRVGIRWRYVGGLPYTPWDLEKSARLDVWKLTGGPVSDFSRLNSERFTSFHQLDTRIDKSYYLRNLTAKFYIDIQNLYSYQAEQQDIIVREEDGNGNYQLTPDGKSYILRKVANTTGTLLPSIGIILEF
jgi:outer membrane receptor for ferrienterochelin and colicin